MLSPRTLVSAGAAFFTFTAAALGQCGLRWQPVLDVPGTSTRVTGLVEASDGVYACGWFEVAGGVVANRVARFDGSAWHPLGDGLDDACTCLITMPNGDIVVGGHFANAGSVAAAHIARWDGTSWSSFGAGFNGLVHALCVMPNGDLVAGGSFTASGGQQIPKLARWDGSSWSDIGGSVTLGQVYALQVLPGGELAVGGTFQQTGQQAGSSTATGFGIWDGASWTTPATSPGKTILAFELLPNGDLVFGGRADSPTDNLGVWDGQSVQYVTTPIDGTVHEMLLDSSGDLVLGGGSTFGGEGTTVARRSNGVWTVLDFGLNKVFGLAEWQGRPFAGGGALGENQAPTVREYDGSDWLPVGGPELPVYFGELAPAPSGGVYVAGRFDEVGGVAANYIAEFDGSNWHALGAGVDSTLTAITTAPNGDLIVAGYFDHAGGAPATRIARWNGTSWSTLGAGLSDAAVDLLVNSQGQVVALLPTAPYVHVFDGLAWASLPDPSTLIASTRSIVEMPNGNLVINGLVGTAAALEWNGSSWTELGSQFANGSGMLVDRNGDLLMSGVFSFGLGIGRWDGTSWNDVGSLGGIAGSLVELPNGDLIAVGPALLINPTVPGNSARWAGQTWTALDGGTGLSMGAANAIRTATVSNRGELYCVGLFATMGPNNVVSPRFGRAVSDCPATSTSFGAGCSGAAGPVSLQAVSQPWIGSTFAARADGMAPSSLALQAIGTTQTVAPLPGGAPGCSLFVQPDLLSVLVPSSGSADMALQVPGDPSIAGLTLRTQVIGLELGASFSITRITSSNALDLTIGAL